MNPTRSFDRLAAIYRGLEYLAFGRDLERARFAHLGHLHDRKTILVLGEGDGRCLAQMVKAAPRARIDCIDFSAAMLARAAHRIAGTEAALRVTFREADALTAPLAPARYDAVVTFFFLDCFDSAQAEGVLARISRSLQPAALWLWADFAMPARGLARWRARAWLALLYTFFRWQTGLSARALPAVERWFTRSGWTPAAECSLQHGLVRSAVFHREV